jgi:HEPN domain-containing protein
VGPCAYAPIGLLVSISRPCYITTQPWEQENLIDIEKQIAYWRDGAEEDMDVARDLIARGRNRHALFLAQLALEKVLKAHVCRQTGDLAPKIHSLVRLAELGAVQTDKEQLDTLAEMNAFNVEGRYPETLAPPPTVDEAKRYFERAQEVFEWLMQLL